DVRGDLYSLGCTFYYLLTGQVPYPGGNGTEKLLRHSLDAPVSVRDLRPDVPAEVAVIVERLMARELEDRYPTEAAVAADLSALRLNEEKPEEVAPRSRRSPTATRFSYAALAGILLGVAAAGGARWIVSRPPSSTVSQPEMLVPPFHIEGRPDDFTSLAQALAAASDGDVVTIRGSGPFRSPPLSLQGKALTVRAAEGVRPRLEMKPGDDPWQALFHTDRPLTLEGLDLAIAGTVPDAHRSHGGSLICCAGASVQLIDCRLTTAPDNVAIIARNVGEILVRRCRIDAGSVGVSVEVGRNSTCRLRVLESRLSVREASGAALSLWAPEVSQPTAVDLQLQENTIHAGRMAAFQMLPAGLTIEANGNRFTFGTALLSFSGYQDGETCQRNLIWHEADNSYDGPASRLWINGQPVPLTEQTPR